MNGPEMLKAVIALVVVLALLAFFAWGLRKIAERKWLSGLRPQGSMSVKETLYLDARHRLVLVSDSDTDHMILLGPGTPVVVMSRPAKAIPHG